MPYKINYLQVASIASLVVGVILIFLSLFNVFPFPYYIITASLGALGVIAYFVIKYLMNRKDHPKTVKPHPGKVQKAQKIKDDKEHVLVFCPSCGRKLRLPNSRGKHSVTCPVCKKEFEIKI